MKATINGVSVEGTADELVQFVQAVNQPKKEEKFDWEITTKDVTPKEPKFKQNVNISLPKEGIPKQRRIRGKLYSIDELNYIKSRINVIGIEGIAKQLNRDVFSLNGAIRRINSGYYVKSGVFPIETEVKKEKMKKQFSPEHAERCRTMCLERNEKVKQFAETNGLTFIEGMKLYHKLKREGKLPTEFNEVSAQPKSEGLFNFF